MGQSYLKNLPPELRRALRRINGNPRWDVEVRRRVAGEVMHLKADWENTAKVTLTNAQVTSRGVVRCVPTPTAAAQALDSTQKLAFRDDGNNAPKNADGVANAPQRIAFGIDYFPNPDVLGTGEIRLLGVDVYFGREVDADGIYWGLGDAKAALRARVLTASDTWDLVPLSSERFLTLAEVSMAGGVLSLDFSAELLLVRPERVLTKMANFVADGRGPVVPLESYRPISLELLPLGDSEANTCDAFIGGGALLDTAAYLNDHVSWGPVGPVPPGANDGGGQMAGDFDARTLWGGVPGHGALADVHGDGRTYGWFALSQRLTRRAGVQQGGSVFPRAANCRVPYAVWTVEKFVNPVQVVVNIDLGAVPTEGVGEFRAEYKTPSGTSLRVKGYQGSTLLDGDVRDGDQIAGLAQTYRIEATGTPSPDGWSTPEIHTLGVEVLAATSFRSLSFPWDGQTQIDPVEGKASVAELPVELARAGAPIRRDGKDPASRLVSESYPTDLQIDLYLGAGEPKQRSRNLVQNSDLNRDSDGNGFADGVSSSRHTDFTVTALGIEDGAQKYRVKRVADTGGWGGGLKIDLFGVAAKDDVFSGAIEMRVATSGTIMTQPRAFLEVKEDGVNSFPSSPLGLHSAGGGWERLKTEGWKIPVVPEGGKVSLMTRISGGAVGDEVTVWVRKAQVVRGATVGPYDPNPPRGRERLHLNRYNVARRRPVQLGEELVGISLLERLQVTVPVFEQIGTDGGGQPIYERRSTEWLDQDIAVVLRDVLQNVVNIPDRELDLDALPTATGFLTRMRIDGTSPEEGKEIADQLAFLCGGALDWDAGRITYVVLFGAVAAGAAFVPKETVAVWREHDYVRLDVDPGLEHRIPEFYTSYAPDKLGGTDFAREVRSVHADALELLGKVQAEERHELPKEVARWCSGSNGQDKALSEAIGYRMVRAFGSGFRRMEVETAFPQPWIRRGAQVVVITDRWTDRLPRLDGSGQDIGRPLRGRVGVPAIVIGRNERGTRWTLWVRDPQAIVQIDQAAGQLRGELDLPPHVSGFAAVELARPNPADPAQVRCTCAFPDWPYLDGWVVEAQQTGEADWLVVAEGRGSDLVATIQSGAEYTLRGRARSASGKLADAATAPTAVLTTTGVVRAEILSARFRTGTKDLVADVAFGPETRSLRVEVTPVPPNAVGGAVSHWDLRPPALPEPFSSPFLVTALDGAGANILFDAHDPAEYTLEVTPYADWDDVNDVVAGTAGEPTQVTMESRRSRVEFPDFVVLPVGTGKWLPV